MGKSVDYAKTCSPLTFAFLGDAVYSLYVRDEIVRQGNTAASALHERTAQIVNARAQAKAVDTLSEILTGEEADIVRRGTNAKPLHHAKSASLLEYHKATGLEALFGYLYLEGRTDRIKELTEICMREEDSLKQNEQ